MAVELMPNCHTMVDIVRPSAVARRTRTSWSFGSDDGDAYLIDKTYVLMYESLTSCGARGKTSNRTPRVRRCRLAPRRHPTRHRVQPRDDPASSQARGTGNREPCPPQDRATPRYNLDEPGRLASMYPTVLTEAATVDDFRTWLNRNRLIEEWPGMDLPTKVRRLWEDRFPELAGARASASAAQDSSEVWMRSANGLHALGLTSIPARGNQPSGVTRASRGK
jgi:hypothetical protein